MAKGVGVSCKTMASQAIPARVALFDVGRAQTRLSSLGSSPRQDLLGRFKLLTG